jgi:hypothetical protein
LVIQIHIISPVRGGQTLIICILKMALDLHNSQELMVYVSKIDILFSMFLTVLELSEPWCAGALRTTVCWSSQNHGVLLQC